jgi:hypothetical protein
MDYADCADGLDYLDYFDCEDYEDDCLQGVFRIWQKLPLSAQNMSHPIFSCFTHKKGA